MAVLRNKTKRENFLVVSKIFLQDTGLSIAERGLLATMHSLPDDWDFTIRGMEKILPDGEAKIKSALDGLIDKGYISKEQSKANGGKFGKNIIEIYERPLREKPLAENPVTVKPPAEKPLADNQGQYNIKEYSIDQCSNNQSIHLSKEDTTDGQTEVQAYKKLIADNIKLVWLLDTASRHGNDEVQMVQEIYDVICDMVCYPRKDVVIKDTTYPWETVKSRFLKLQYEHIANVLNRIVDADLGIKNMQKYLISTLYTESLVGTIESQADLHDDYLKSLRGKPY